MPMKRFCLFLLLWTGALLLVACSSDNAATGSDVPLDAEPLTARIGYTEALRLAGRGIEMLDSAPQTRATAGRRTIDAQRLRYMLRATTRAGADQDTLLYVFNFADSAGFALVAADRRSGGLLAVTESGNFTPGERTGNPGFDLYMSGVENYLDDLLNTPPLDLPSGEEPLLRREKSTHTESVGPLVTVAWGQHYPYNLYCFDPSGSSAPSGCVATAVAQILSAWSYPPDMHIFYPGPTCRSKRSTGRLSIGIRKPITAGRIVRSIKPSPACSERSGGRWRWITQLAEALHIRIKFQDVCSISVTRRALCAITTLPQSA